MSYLVDDNASIKYNGNSGGFMMKKKIYFILMLSLIIVLSACNNSQSDTLLDSEISLDKSKIVFGVKEDEKIKLNNQFSIGDNPQFVILLKEPVSQDSIHITLKKLKNDEWLELSSSELPVEKGSVEITNGLSGEIFKKTGGGAYKMVASVKGEKLASGDFVVGETQ